MRARSMIFINQQQPVTVFGIAPVLLGCSVGISVLLGVVFIVLKISWLAYLGMLLTLIVLLGLSWRITRKEPHFITIMGRCGKFWRGYRRHSCRYLLSYCPRGVKP